jgi:hypothetical protein
MGLSTVVTGHVGGPPAGGQGKGGFDLGDVATLAHIGKTDSERRVLGSNVMSAAQQRLNARAGRRVSVELASGLKLTEIIFVFAECGLSFRDLLATSASL